MSQLEEQIPTCARHPKVTTYLTCAGCGTPICPDCFVQTPVGYKCRECGVNRNPSLHAISPLRALGVALIGLAAGMLAALVLGRIGLFMLFLAIPYGRFAGYLMLLASGRKTGLTMEILAGVSIALGGLLTIGLPLLLTLYYPLPTVPSMPTGEIIRGMLVSALYPALAVIVTAASAVSRIRYAWGVF